MEVSQPQRIVQTYGVVERAVIGLDQLLAPTSWNCGRESTSGCATRKLISHGKSNAPLQSVRTVTCYSLFQEGATNAEGKELHESSGQPVKADGHRFS